ncbi:MAG: restriction endonuclease subunit S [Flavobacterium sp.]|nr:MAG: restriction endonuclease subunit S [Flavobacterium sp.]
MGLNLKNIPNHWELKKLRDVSKFSNGKGHEQTIDENGQYIVVNSKFISTDGQVSKFSNQNLSPLSFGDITLVMSDIPNGKAIAKCFIIDKDNKYTLNQRICSIQSNKDCNNKFLYYVINRNRYFLAFDNGVSQTNLRRDEVLDCPIPLPPLTEQNKIADILSIIDDKIAIIDQQINHTRELKKGLMQCLLTKGIGHTDFKDSSLGMIPQNWEVVEVGDTGNIVSGGTPKTENLDYWDGEINWITPTDVTALKGKRFVYSTKRKITELGLTNSAANLLPENSLIICTRATIGDCVINKTKISTNQGFKSIIPNVNFDVVFLYYSILNIKSKLLQLSSGSTFLELSTKAFKKIEILSPSIEEQKKIGVILSSVDEKIDVLVEKKLNYQELKQGLMQQLLTGKIRVKV